MSTTTKIFLGVIVMALLVAVFAFSTYNGIIALDQETKSKWSVVEAQYQRRADLVPNLVAVVKGAANFEQTTLTEVVEARAKATAVTVDPSKLDAESIAKFQAAQGELGMALGKLMVLTENYPQLRATENFKDLQSQIEGTENRITVARKDFTDAVQSYNTRIKQFPANMFAGMFGFSEKAYFKADDTAARAPAVEL